MFICICNAVTDNQIKSALDSGAKSMSDLNKTLAVGSCCGKCVRPAREIMKQHQLDKKLELLTYNAA
ncbi:(2Fe-2S)-binding protein [Marinomonas sp. 15G1-11]|uniref:Bacterioferritin-associated ferredoxin n=1 Tax=Marinomonas phaeophyticola TaxID=3004091 RepID=A0ABT4JVP4_9GAMM|nr:(2Fe-2S)-binding protein [Marinomonas sp. 15G1-11]MCZ2722457.1 (2Fe-2S)-binding protein [Marinomonas sp. 15G1-11]